MNWTEEDIKAAWERAQPVGKINPGVWRKDDCGAWISRRHYGNHDSIFGWDIIAYSNGNGNGNGGGSESTGTVPAAFQWKNAASKLNGDRICPVSSYGGENFERR